MVQKYQNESAPIFYYGKSPKTSRKHLKIPYLQALTLGRVIKMTLYMFYLLCVGRLVSEVGEIQDSVGLLNDKLREAQTVHQVTLSSAALGSSDARRLTIEI